MECDKAMVHKKQARCFFFVFFNLKIEARFLLKKKKKKKKRKEKKIEARCSSQNAKTKQPHIE